MDYGNTKITEHVIKSRRITTKTLNRRDSAPDSGAQKKRSMTQNSSSVTLLLLLLIKVQFVVSRFWAEWYGYINKRAPFARFVVYIYWTVQ